MPARHFVHVLRLLPPMLFVACGSGASTAEAPSPVAPQRFFPHRDDQTLQCVTAATTRHAIRACGAVDASLADGMLTPASHFSCVPPLLTFALAGFAARVLNR